MDTRCTVCDAERRPAFEHQVLQRHLASYWTCDACGLLQAAPATWLAEAYATPIADTDTGILQRNVANADLLTVLLDAWFDGDGRYVDAAGGYGLLTRMLRDRGFDCYTFDRYSKNLFAGAFEARPGLEPKALFAFEVLEHLEQPRAFLETLFSTHGCRTLVFSTETFVGSPPAPRWWYYAFETGQHITFYQPRTLAALAARLGCGYTMLDRELHVFSPAPLPPVLRFVLRHPRLRVLALRRALRRRAGRSLTWADHLAAKAVIEGARRDPPASP